MSVNAHDKFNGDSAQKLRLLHITTPLHFPHVVHIQQQEKSPRAGNEHALPPFRALSHLSRVFGGLNGAHDPEARNDSEVTGLDRFDQRSKLKRANRTHLLEEVERRKMSKDVRG
jgi:hypothetical protein